MDIGLSRIEISCVGGELLQQRSHNKVAVIPPTTLAFNGLNCDTEEDKNLHNLPGRSLETSIWL